MTNVLGAKPVVDTNTFESSLRRMSADLRVLESGFRASTASMGDWAQTGTGLETRIKSLNSQMEIQRQKVAALKGEYERIKAATGENTMATKFAEERYNKSVETLGKMESELGKTEGALKEVKAPTDKAGEAAEQAGTKWEGFKSVLGGVAMVATAAGGVLKGVFNGIKVVVEDVVKVILAIGTAAIVAAGALGMMVFKSATAADQISQLSLETGISTTRLQELAYAGTKLDVSLETITSSSARLIRSMNMAAGGSKTQEAAFKALGVSVTDSNGNLRDSQVVYAEVIDALGKIENPTERDALAMELFGKSAQELNPLIKAGSEELAKYSREAHTMGAVVSKEGIEALDQFKDNFDAMILSLKGIGASISILILPDFSQFLSGVQGLLGEVAYLLTGSGGDITKILNGYFEITPDGRVLFHRGIIEMILGIADAIAANAPKLVDAGLKILDAILLGISSNLPRLLTAGSTLLTGILQAIIDNLPLLLSTGTTILTTLLDAIKENLPIIQPMVEEILKVLVDMLSMFLPLLVDAGMQILTMVLNGMAANADQATPAIINLVNTIIATILYNSPAFVAAGGSLLANIFLGMIYALPQGVQDFMTQLVFGLANGIANTVIGLGFWLSLITNSLKQATVNKAFKQTLNEAGSQIVEGLWAGILGMSGWLIAQFGAFIEACIDAALGHPKSPAPISIPAGRKLAMGIEFGMNEEFKAMSQRMALTFGNLALSPAFASAGGSSGNNYDYSNNTSSSISIGGIQMPNMSPQTTIADIMAFLNKR
jgi:hypothetical protein